jgi:hypothetical protein
MQIRKSHKQILATILYSLFFFSPQLHGQTDSTINSDSIAEGSWALQFGISDDFTLTSFKGSVLSAQYHLSTATAIRVSLSGEISFYSTRGTHEDPDRSNRQSFTVTSEYLFYSNPHKRVFFFWGLGPTVELYREYYTSQETHSTIGSYSISKSEEYREWSIGPTVVAGVEWFAAAWFSLHAEYGVAATYSWSKRMIVWDRTSGDPLFPPEHLDYETTSKSWRVSPSGVWFGASVYP